MQGLHACFSAFLLYFPDFIFLLLGIERKVEGENNLADPLRWSHLPEKKKEETIKYINK